MKTRDFGPKGQDTSLPPAIAIHHGEQGGMSVAGGGGTFHEGGLALVLIWLMASGGGGKQRSHCSQNYWSCSATSCLFQKAQSSIGADGVSE